MIDVQAISDLGVAAGVDWFDYQEDALVAAAGQPGPAQRRLLYYKTGAGKSLTALGQLRLWGHTEAVVITPPSTYAQWQEIGQRLGVDVDCISHAKFRMKDTRLSRTKAIIADEFHLFGGHDGKGWAKFDRMARGLQAPIIMCSATPNYNDADRVYCIQHVLDPHSCKGGFLAFIYAHCTTEPNMFGIYPNVTGFIHHKDAAGYLSSLPNVDYLPDDLVYQITDYPVPSNLPPEFHTYGLNRRRSRIMASGIERKHAKIDLTMINDNGLLRHPVDDIVKLLLDSTVGPVLIFAQHATVAQACDFTVHLTGKTHAVVDGSLTTKVKAGIIADFIAGKYQVLIGTASLATGTDGLDKVCNTLLILDDTEDDALRRQLVGRIMPRGASTNVSSKRVIRVALT